MLTFSVERGNAAAQDGSLGNAIEDLIKATSAKRRKDAFGVAPTRHPRLHAEDPARQTSGAGLQVGPRDKPEDDTLGGAAA